MPGENSVPHAEQNLAETETVAPQEGHGRDRDVPQLGQKAADSETCEPQLEHVAMPNYGQPVLTARASQLQTPWRESSLAHVIWGDADGSSLYCCGDTWYTKGS